MTVLVMVNSGCVCVCVCVCVGKTHWGGLFSRQSTERALEEERKNRCYYPLLTLSQVQNPKITPPPLQTEAKCHGKTIKKHAILIAESDHFFDPLALATGWRGPKRAKELKRAKEGHYALATARVLFPGRAVIPLASLAKANARTPRAGRVKKSRHLPDLQYLFFWLSLVLPFEAHVICRIMSELPAYCILFFPLSIFLTTLTLTFALDIT